eukprot:scaffold2730_cov247-Pinguiococcus_pyrenoidosus.AAC.5
MPSDELSCMGTLLAAGFRCTELMLTCCDHICHHDPFTRHHRVPSLPYCGLGGGSASPALACFVSASALPTLFLCRSFLRIEEVMVA